MGQIAKKKKGRPSKADLAERELRRSGRRRNVKYTIDFDDYLDDDEYSFFEEEEDEQRREKKIKLLLKLHGATDYDNSRRNGRIDEDRKGIDDEDDEENVGGEDDNYDQINDDEEDDDEVKGEKGQDATSEVDYAPGSECPSECPLPDKKTLELILHKLQKKDVYGVYAEPVDPEELPDYRDLIDNPMDFSTIRRKLSNGSYATLEQFESDVFLLCSNAMQYNESDTAYHKQAMSIQDLAKRKFQKLRIDHERLENQMKSEQKPKPGSVFKKQIRRQASRTLQEPIGSDFSAGASPATVVHTKKGSNGMQASQKGSNGMHAGGIENVGSLDVIVQGNCFMIDTSVDKLEESLAGKGSLPRFGRKAPTQEENRATCSIGSQPTASSDSTLSPFDGETKQLIPVGLYVEHAYARSLSRFAGSLGTVAWRVASKRIEKILPSGTKFGRGWVGEYEPLPTPVLFPDNYNIESDFLAKPQHTDNCSKHKMFMNPVASGDSYISSPPLERKLPFINPALSGVTTSSSGNILREEPSRSSFPQFLHSNSQMSNIVKSSNKVVQPVELIGASSANHNLDELAIKRWVFQNAEAPTRKSDEMVPVRSSLPLTSFKQSNISGLAFGSCLTDKPLVNGRNINCAAVGGKEPPLCSDMNKVGPHISHGQELALNDPVQLMKMLTEKNRNQQYPANQSAFSCLPVPLVAQSVNREYSSNSAAAVTHPWTSMGSGGLRPTVDNRTLQKNQIPAESLYNATLAQQSQFSRFRGELPAPIAYFQPGRNNYPFHGAVQFQNQPIGVPQFSPADLSRLQAQSPRRNLSPPTQQAQKHGACPPDLNVSFQSVASPGVVVDSRQPDLALQL